METPVPIEEIIMKLIVESGEAKSAAFEAIQAAKEGNLTQAKERMEYAKEHLLNAHHQQTGLLQKEAGGEKTQVTLLMVHAQDHLMTAMTVRDLAAEIIELYTRLAKAGGVG